MAPSSRTSVYGDVMNYFRGSGTFESHLGADRGGPHVKVQHDDPRREQARQIGIGREGHCFFLPVADVWPMNVG